MGTSRAQHRALLVALNTRLDLSRDAVCRLALCYEEWASARSREALTEIAQRLRVSQRHLAVARRLRHQASAIAARELVRATALGAEITTLTDPDYPPALRDLELPPPVLYMLGRLPRRPAVAIVGSRRADPYALEAAKFFARELARSGLAVISGLARGVDAAAHRGALRADGGSTLAVQACGIDRTYPPRHAGLATDICRAGAVLTEFPIGTEPLARNFPIRNRLIAALSVGTLVVQAARRSGTLITARLALELGRDVYAIPGQIFEKRAAGANELLRDGALIALEPRDIMESLPLAIQDRLVETQASRSADRPRGLGGTILTLLSDHSSMAPDEISVETSSPIADVLATLAELELAGRVRRYPGPVFHVVRTA